MGFTTSKWKRAAVGAGAVGVFRKIARELYRLGLESVPFPLAVGHLLIGWLLLQRAEIALAAPEAS